MTKTKQRLVEAYARGYRVSEDGVVSSSRVVLKVARYGKQKYPTFCTNWGGIVFSIPVHMLAAYCFYKDKYLFSNLIVRHLDGNVLNLSRANIVLGTHSENNLDKDSSSRKRAAQIARKSQGFTPTNAKLTSAQVLAIRKIYSECIGKKLPPGMAIKMTQEFGVSRTVLCKIKNKEYYPNVC